MKKYTLILLLLLTFMAGCNALGIKESDNTTKEPNVEENSNNFLDDNQVSNGNQVNFHAEQIAELQKEIDELVSTLNTKDMTIVELENKVTELTAKIDELSGQVANTQAAYDNLQGTISANNQYRNIAIIVALASILLNIILVYMLIKTKSKYSRAALPPAKKDDEANKDNNKADEKPQSNDKVTEESAAATETNTDETISPKKGRPKKEENSPETQTETPAVAKKRGRPKKDTSNE